MRDVRDLEGALFACKGSLYDAWLTPDTAAGVFLKRPRMAAVTTPSWFNRPYSLCGASSLGAFLERPRPWADLDNATRAWFGAASGSNVSRAFGMGDGDAECNDDAPCCDAWPDDPSVAPTSRQVGCVRSARNESGRVRIDPSNALEASTKGA